MLEHVPVPDYYICRTPIVTQKQTCSDFVCLILRVISLPKSWSLGQIGGNGWMTRGTAGLTIRSKHFCKPRGLPRHHSSTQPGHLHDLRREITPGPLMFRSRYARSLPWDI